MKHNSILLCLLFAITASFITPAAKAQAVSTSDSLALVDLYNSTNGPNWRNHNNWLTANPVSTWHGITVNGSHVAKIILSNDYLSGSLPVSIGNLSFLTYLDLTKNKLTGTIPAEIGNLTKLNILYLNYNQLTGTIPATIGNLTSLSILYLYYNQLTGAIPVEIGNLTNLTNLNLNSNQLTGTIPTGISNLTKLTFLYLAGNQLTGTIPAVLGNLKKLTTLDLSVNQLTGTIPAVLGNLKKLTTLDLSFNQLTGAIPVEIGNLTNLLNLLLSNNQLSGTIPVEISNLINIVNLALNNNQLTGTIPSSLGNLTNVEHLNLNNNQLSGAIPSSLNKIKNSAIDLHSNLLSQFGDIHSAIDTDYIVADISSNLFTFDGLQFIANKYPNIRYFPQSTILPIHQTDNTLSVSAGGTLSNNTYTWFKVRNTSKTVIQADSTFSPAQSGKYYVKAINKIAKNLTLYSDTVSYTMPVAQTNNSIANVAEVKTATAHFTIYPNPASSTIHIQTSGATSIILTNAAGKTLLTKTINSSDVINVSSLANGTYYIQNKTTRETLKVVVLH